jgi:hypothetical protein
MRLMYPCLGLSKSWQSLMAALLLRFRTMGRRPMYVCSGQCFLQLLTWTQSAEELSSMVLTKMKETAEQYLNKKVK